MLQHFLVWPHQIDFMSSENYLANHFFFFNFRKQYSQEFTFYEMCFYLIHLKMEETAMINSL